VLEPRSCVPHPSHDLDIRECVPTIVRNSVYVRLHYRDGRLNPQSLSVLADRRNYVQHSLMSLPADSESKGMVQAADPFYELTRLAAIIYSLLVTFPLPPRTASFAELALHVISQFQIRR
jgi:hypothetical protein